MTDTSAPTPSTRELTLLACLRTVDQMLRLGREALADGRYAVAQRWLHQAWLHLRTVEATSTQAEIAVADTAAATHVYLIARYCEGD